MESVGGASFFPDGKRLIVGGAEHGHAFRTYAVNISDGKPTPITPEGVVSYVLSHDGENVAAQDVSGNIAIYSVEEKPPRSVPGTQGMLPVHWGVDGHSVFTTVPDEIPARIFRIDLAGGRQELVRRLQPGDSGGVYSLWDLRLSPDGKSYAYSYRQTLSDLYVAEGLH